MYVAKSQNTNKNPANEATIWDIVATQKWCEDSFMKKTDVTDATEAKAGIAKLKNIINAKQTDTAVTEKAVVDFVQSHTPPSLGVGQTWQDVTSQRRMNETYTNTTDKPIYIQVNINNAANVMFWVEINSIKIEHNEDYRCVMNYIIPPNATYKVYSQNGATNYVYTKWYELR